jgi:hypothetical protein
VDTHELYQTIIDGLRRYRDDPFIGDVLRAVSSYPRPSMAHSLNKNQMASKRWLLEALAAGQPGRLDMVLILGGWYGVLAAMLLSDSRFDLGRVYSLDLDPDCQPVAETLNRRHLRAGRFSAVTRDMMSLNLRRDLLPTIQPDGGSVPMPVRPDLVINTSCEHIEDFGHWYRRVPSATLLVLQSNDYFSCDEHVNCVADIDTFRRQAPMQQLMFAGALPLKRYTRFMLIGRK